MSHEIKPERHELETARHLVIEALEKVEDRFPKEEKFTVSVGWSGQSFVREKMDGSAGTTYSSRFFEINFNSEADRWKTAIKTTTVHEYAHAWHYEKRFEEGRNEYVWQYVIDEAITQRMAEKIFPGYEAPQRTKHSKEKVSEYWQEVRDKELDREFSKVDYPYPLYIDRSGDNYPLWLGYSLSYLIGGKLLEDHDLEDFPDLKKVELVEAGNSLFT